MIAVLDASVTIARVHPHERTLPIVQLFDQVAQHGSLVPPLWRVEVANVLQMNVRKQRYDVAERDKFLRDIALLNVEVDSSPIDHLWTTTLDLAHRHKLTVYDAVYLELALRHTLPLATLDQALRAAATTEGVPLLGL